MMGWHIRFIFYSRGKADKLGETLVFEDFTTELLFSLLASVVHGSFLDIGGHWLCSGPWLVVHLGASSKLCRAGIVSSKYVRK